ncbi:hypothetical protein [Natrinema amylolyticum]|uniref:hypothetical protein n=1 Tax=Natrinema amylolyticum TaxID=2878679 RepID=UPI001CFA74CA|nr:hypothetical protein [Natrinema amylolyticum]
MTHRRTHRVCQTCHPSLQTASETTQSSERLVADGGTRGAHCPVCSGATVVDTGSYACVDCGWTGTQ